MPRPHNNQGLAWSKGGKKTAYSIILYANRSDPGQLCACVYLCMEKRVDAVAGIVCLGGRCCTMRRTGS